MMLTSDYSPPQDYPLVALLLVLIVVLKWLKTIVTSQELHLT